MKVLLKLKGAWAVYSYLLFTTMTHVQLFLATAIPVTDPLRFGVVLITRPYTLICRVFGVVTTFSPDTLNRLKYPAIYDNFELLTVEGIPNRTTAIPHLSTTSTA